MDPGWQWFFSVSSITLGIIGILVTIIPRKYERITRIQKNKTKNIQKTSYPKKCSLEMGHEPTPGEVYIEWRKRQRPKHIFECSKIILLISLILYFFIHLPIIIFYENIWSLLSKLNTTLLSTWIIYSSVLLTTLWTICIIYLHVLYKKYYFWFNNNDSSIRDGLNLNDLKVPILLIGILWVMFDIILFIYYKINLSDKVIFFIYIILCPLLSARFGDSFYRNKTSYKHRNKFRTKFSINMLLYYFGYAISYYLLCKLSLM